MRISWTEHLINVKVLRRIRNQKETAIISQMLIEGRKEGLENLTPTGITNISSEFEKMDDGTNAI